VNGPRAGSKLAVRDQTVDGALSAAILGSVLRFGLICSGAAALTAALCACAVRPGWPASAATSSAPATPTVERRLAAMGTTLTLEVWAPTRERALEASEAAYLAVRAVETRLSTWTDESELARLNSAHVGALQPLSAELQADLRACERWWRTSNGAFDPCVGALVELWDLRGAGRVPAAHERDAAVVAGGFGAGFELVDGGALRKLPHARLEEGGFGKGLGLDAALAALHEFGVERALVDLGGQVAVHGMQQPLRWSVADPRDRSRPVLSWELRDGSIATTSNSERARVVDGERIGHVLDPRSGSPARDFGSVSVGARSAADADAWSTALFVLGPDAALELVAQRAELEVVVIELTPSGLRAHASASLRGRVSSLVPDLALDFSPTDAR